MAAYKAIVMWVSAIVVALTGATPAAAHSTMGAGPFRTLKTYAIIIPDDAQCPTSVPEPPQAVIDVIKKGCKKGASDAETCARCDCALMALAARPEQWDTATRRYILAHSAITDAEEVACAKVYLTKAGMSEDIIKAATTQTCNWDAVRALPVCQETLLDIAGCVKPAPTILDAYKTNCSIADITDASCLNCRCTEASIYNTNMNKEGFDANCFEAGTITLLSKAMLKARGQPVCKVSEAQVYIKCPWSAKKSGASNLVGMPLGALGAALLLLVLV